MRPPISYYVIVKHILIINKKYKMRIGTWHIMIEEWIYLKLTKWIYFALAILPQRNMFIKHHLYSPSNIFLFYTGPLAYYVELIRALVVLPVYYDKMATQNKNSKRIFNFNDNYLMGIFV